MGDYRIETSRNRVFETENGIAFGKNLPGRMETKDDSVYRITGMNQVKDIISCGYVRPKEGKISGGHKNEIFWSRGSDKLFFFDKSRVVLEAYGDKVLDNQIGGIPIEDLCGIWLYDNKKECFVNRLEFYMEVYKSIHEVDSMRR